MSSSHTGCSLTETPSTTPHGCTRCGPWSTLRAHADRESLVTLAKTLLAGTPHTVADIIAMANFLAGE
ncbi:hypothetical protein SMICM304S_11447 [Streptomyces microflavus]